MFAPLKKGTLLIVSGTLECPDKKHLFVVLNDPHVGEVLLASFSRIRPGIPYDPTCVVAGNGREHEFLIVPSYVRYGRLRIEQDVTLIRGVRERDMAPSRPVRDDLFDRICQGVHVSEFAAPKFRKFLGAARAAGC